MKLRYHQSGLSAIAILCIAAMVGFFALCIIKMGPSYMEYMAVKNIMSRIAAEADANSESNASIRRSIETQLHTNQIYTFKSADVEVYRKDGKTYIDSNYEVRIPIFWRVDAVMKYDGLVFEAGKPDPV
ncbi:MAG: DUF4845 domain-containing protein [Parahaliea sp.]